jgi:ABC-type antimicrobial peptide transport system permease subunit
MKSGLREFYVLKKPNVADQNIRNLILLQVLFLILTTIPAGLFSGYLLTGKVLNMLAGFSLDSHTMNMIDSITTFYAISGLACASIITIGIYLERRTRKAPLSSILSDYQAI